MLMWKPYIPYFTIEVMISGCANDHIDNQEKIEDRSHMDDPDANHEQELVEFRNEEILDEQVNEERADPENVQDDHDPNHDHGVDDYDYGLDDYDDYNDDYYDDGDDYCSD